MYARRRTPTRHSPMRTHCTTAVCTGLLLRHRPAATPYRPGLVKVSLLLFTVPVHSALNCAAAFRHVLHSLLCLLPRTRTPDGRGYVAVRWCPLWQYISLRRLNFSPSSFVALLMCPACPICCAMFAFRFVFVLTVKISLHSTLTFVAKSIGPSGGRDGRAGFVQTQFIQGQSKTKTVRRTALPLSLFVYLCLFRHVVLSYRLSVISLVLSSCALCALITVTLSCMHLRCTMHFSYYHLIVSYMHNMCYIHVVGYSVTIC